MRRAFKASWRGTEGIVAGDSASKARAQVYRNLLDAFDSRDVRMQDIRVVRFPDFDSWAAKDTTGRAMNEGILRRQLETTR